MDELDNRRVRLTVGDTPLLLLLELFAALPPVRLAKNEPLLKLVLPLLALAVVDPVDVLLLLLLAVLLLIWFCPTGVLVLLSV